MRRVVLLIGSLSLALLSACTPEQQQVIDDITEPGDSGGCVIGGCSGQLCIEEGDDGVSTCEFREEYACYNTASCERQADGQCGWTQTEELTSCLGNAQGTFMEINGCENDADCEGGQTCSVACTQSNCSTDGNCAQSCRGQCVSANNGSQSADYSIFMPSVLTDGETKVLFFHAAWCPVCRAADADLQEWFAQNLPTLNVYKVDYDTSADLKAKYGVTYQHTFVLVDGQGNALKTIQGPSDAALKELIGAPQ
jgi:thiol-disulfide isomerase/thioredoxin